MVIDIHAHYIPHDLISRLRVTANLGVKVIDGAKTPALQFNYGLKTRPFFPQLMEEVSERAAWLDSQKIDYQLVATWPDIYGYGLPQQECNRWHQLLNDILSNWCNDNRRRFGFIASVPLPNASDAEKELKRVLTLGACGVMVSANIEGTNIGEFSLDSFWAEAERSACPVILHPVLTGPAPRASKFGLTQSTQYTFDTTLGAGSLLFSGVLDRFPCLNIVLSHGGGAFPYLAGRFDIMHARMDRAAQADVALETPSSYAHRFAYDSILHAAKPLQYLAALVGIDRIMLGSDYSFPPADLTPLLTLKNAGFSTQQIQQIAEENPRKMFLIDQNV
jgi:aminocarboxymuconate-semialdehyde decarboxylase